MTEPGAESGVSFDIPYGVRKWAEAAGFEVPRLGDVRAELPPHLIALVESLLAEESRELVAALASGDPYQAAAEACDVIFNAVFVLALLGVPLSIIWPEMYRSYARRLEPPVTRNALGRILKSHTFIPADPHGAIEVWQQVQMTRRRLQGKE